MAGNLVVCFRKIFGPKFHSLNLFCKSSKSLEMPWEYGKNHTFYSKF